MNLSDIPTRDTHSHTAQQPVRTSREAIREYATRHYIGLSRAFATCLRMAEERREEGGKKDDTSAA